QKPELGSIVRPAPLKPELLAVLGAVSKIHVDEGLVRHPHPFAEALEVGERRFLEPDGYLLLQSLCVGISTSLRKIIMLSHVRVPREYSARSDGSALRAEMILITSPP